MKAQQTRNAITYRVQTFREAGLQARWTKTRHGAPIIAANNGNGWYVVNRLMWERAHEVGIKEAFHEHTLLGCFFSIPA